MELVIEDLAASCPEDIVVMYSVDGEVQKAEACSAAIDNAGNCSCDALLGELKSGDYAISVASPDGKRRATTKIVVESEGCVPVTQNVDLSLL